VVAPDPSSDGRWTNDPGLEVAVPGYLAALGTLDPSHLAGGVPIATTDPTVDAGVAVGGVTTDLLGSARPADGDGDGSAAPDVGPFEAPAPTPPPPSTTTTTPTTDEPTTTELTTTTEATGP
jgi:hypothetical protein